ncbi:hypothetical protein [Gordonia aurantiaca]|uniref:hypothetical protein n=1 Tax=Gordonia sp. B21 TaxID=3151852 RepID=UPI0032669620
MRCSIPQGCGTLTTGSPKTRAGVRTVPIPRSLLPTLNARIGRRPRTAAAVTSPRGPD